VHAEAPSLAASAEREALLPREFLWLTPLVPLLFTPVIVSGLLDRSGLDQLRAFAGFLVPGVIMPAVFQLLYITVMPRLHHRLPPGRWRWLLHVGAVLVVPPAVAVLIHPLQGWVNGRPVPLWQFVLTCGVLSAVLVLPAVALQQLRLRARAHERQAAAERQAALEAQLSALQARTDPHFLFNTLNTVACLIPEDPRLAERTVERLGDLFRYVLGASRTRSVPLARELEMVRDYLEIQGARFGNRLRASVEVADGLGALEVPPWCSSRWWRRQSCMGWGGGPGSVRVSVRRAGAVLTLRLCDDGPGPGASTHRGTQTAVRDLRERLRLTYGDGVRVEVIARPGGGCEARVELPAGGGG
jgi:two-component system sensor histidine kinase AlgZ